eukprot:Seg4607.4 transcript_id=Seg4607.4/GoldUCD/mRNA.D3Y31 product="hypothetical protein" protein_id=Seg4607.4/GoldUCD/D3Y31
MNDDIDRQHFIAKAAKQMAATGAAPIATEEEEMATGTAPIAAEEEEDEDNSDNKVIFELEEGDTEGKPTVAQVTFCVTTAERALTLQHHLINKLEYAIDNRLVRSFNFAVNVKIDSKSNCVKLDMVKTIKSMHALNVFFRKCLITPDWILRLCTKYNLIVCSTNKICNKINYYGDTHIAGFIIPNDPKVAVVDWIPALIRSDDVGVGKLALLATQSVGIGTGRGLPWTSTSKTQESKQESITVSNCDTSSAPVLTASPMSKAEVSAIKEGASFAFSPCTTAPAAFVLHGTDCSCVYDVGTDDEIECTLAELAELNGIGGSSGIGGKPNAGPPRDLTACCALSYASRPDIERGVNIWHKFATRGTLFDVATSWYPPPSSTLSSPITQLVPAAHTDAADSATSDATSADISAPAGDDATKENDYYDEHNDIDNEVWVYRMQNGGKAPNDSALKRIKERVVWSAHPTTEARQTRQFNAECRKLYEMHSRLFSCIADDRKWDLLVSLYNFNVRKNLRKMTIVKHGSEADIANAKLLWVAAPNVDFQALGDADFMEARNTISHVDAYPIASVTKEVVVKPYKNKLADATIHTNITLTNA